MSTLPRILVRRTCNMLSVAVLEGAAQTIGLRLTLRSLPTLT